MERCRKIDQNPDSYVFVNASQNEGDALKMDWWMYRYLLTSIIIFNFRSLQNLFLNLVFCRRSRECPALAESDTVAQETYVFYAPDQGIASMPTESIFLGGVDLNRL